MRKVFITVLLACILALLSGCTVAKVKTEYNSKTNTYEGTVEILPSVNDDIKNILNIGK